MHATLMGSLLGLAIVTRLMQPASAADIFYGGEGHVGTRRCDFHIIGQIGATDGDRFRQKMLKAIEEGCRPEKAILYSPGGDLRAAIDIGRQLAVLQMHTEAPEVLLFGEPYDAIVARRRACHFRGKVFWFNPVTQEGDRNCVCASACFFIWAAGTKRFGNVVIIHRPYFDPKVYAQLPASQARHAFEELTREARAYLASFEVPDVLVSRMLAVNSRDGSLLSGPEIKQLRSRRFFEELVIARCGRSERELDAANKAASTRASDSARKRGKEPSVGDLVGAMIVETGADAGCEATVHNELLSQGRTEYVLKYRSSP